MSSGRASERTGNGAAQSNVARKAARSQRGARDNLIYLRTAPGVAFAVEPQRRRKSKTGCCIRPARGLTKLLYRFDANQHQL